MKTKPNKVVWIEAGTGELMILRLNYSRDTYIMRDTRDAFLGYFPSVESAQEFCRESGYRLRLEH